MTFFDENFLTKQTAEFIPKLPALKSISVEDYFTVSYTVPERVELTDNELTSIPNGSPFVFDTESFVNYSNHCI